MRIVILVIRLDIENGLCFDTSMNSKLLLEIDNYCCVFLQCSYHLHPHKSTKWDFWWLLLTISKFADMLLDDLCEGLDNSLLINLHDVLWIFNFLLWSLMTTSQDPQYVNNQSTNTKTKIQKCRSCNIIVVNLTFFIGDDSLCLSQLSYNPKIKILLPRPLLQGRTKWRTNR